MIHVRGRWGRLGVTVGLCGSSPSVASMFLVSSMKIQLGSLPKLLMELAFRCPIVSKATLKNPVLKMTKVHCSYYGLPWWLSGKEPACQFNRTGDVSSISGKGRCPGEENDNPLQHSCLENHMDRGTWWGYSPREPQRVRHD